MLLLFIFITLVNYNNLLPCCIFVYVEYLYNIIIDTYISLPTFLEVWGKITTFCNVTKVQIKATKSLIKNFVGYRLADFLNFLLEFKRFCRFLWRTFSPDEWFVFKHMFVVLSILYIWHGETSRRDTKEFIEYAATYILLIFAIYCYLSIK